MQGEKISLVEIISTIALVEIILDLLKGTMGIGMCFFALKWRRGLMTTTAVGWGVFLGAIAGYYAADISDSLVTIIIFMGIGAIVLPILTYNIPGVNRFMIGYIVFMKIAYMFTTELFRRGSTDWFGILLLPMIIGAIGGVILAAWVDVPVSAFVLACAFFGASEAAPIIAKYINYVGYGITQDVNWLIDPLGIIMKLFSIELSDIPTLVSLLILMGFGIPMQLQIIKNQGYSYSIPLIVFETDNKSEHGKIVDESSK